MVRKRVKLLVVAGVSWFLLASSSKCFAMRVDMGEDQVTMSAPLLQTGSGASTSGTTTVTRATSTTSVASSALPINMGTAGSQYWTVLQTGGGSVTLTPPTLTTKKSKKTKKTTAVVSPVSQVAIRGNVGVGESGQILDASEQFQGDVYLGDNTSAQFSGNYTNNSPVNGMVRMGNGSTLSPTTGYSFNNTFAPLQTTLSQVRLDALAASAAASALSPTSTLSSISLAPSKKSKVASLTLTAGVYDLTSLQLSRATLTLSGSGSFVFNISSSFALQSAQVLLANGASASNVLFNYTGTSDVSITAGSAGKKKSAGSSVLNGIILAMNANVNLAQGLVVGEIISGRNILIGGGSQIQGLPNIALPLMSDVPTQPVPEQTSTIVLSFLALCLLVACRPLLGFQFIGLRKVKRAVAG